MGQDASSKRTSEKGTGQQMVDIDYILDLMDWNHSEKDQAKGIALSRKVKCINVFLQPGSPYGKSIWDNCAKVLAEKSDEALSPYLIELMEWLQDLTWPGALRIMERLKRFSKCIAFELALNRCVRIAEALQEEAWLETLRQIMQEPHPSAAL